MADKQRIQALLELGWSYRKIQRETGVHRETVARYDPTNASKPATLAILTLVIYVPFLRDLFHFGTLHPNDLAPCLGAGVACILWFEAVKYFSRPRNKLLINQSG
jgi:hypothetical protein